MSPKGRRGRHLPPRGPWAGHGVWRSSTLALAAACLLAACLPSTGVARKPDLSKLEMDPSKFLKIALRDDVQVRTAEIQAGRGVPRTRWYVVGYSEHDNRKGFVPDRESEYANLFLVSEVERSGEAGVNVKGRYLVVELWHYYLTRGIKTCHQWIIWEDDPRAVPSRASFQLLAEDFNNVFLEERRAPLDPQTLKHLGDYYLEMRRFLVGKAKGLSADLAWQIRPSPPDVSPRDPAIPM